MKDPSSTHNTLQYLKKDLKNNFTVSEWAENIGCTRVRLYRQIRKKHGIAPQKVLILAKLEAIISAFQMKSDHAILLEIAWDIGFENEKSLCEFFLYHTGCKPTDIRNYIRLKNNLLQHYPYK